MKIKRLLAAVLSALMLISCMSFSASAADAPKAFGGTLVKAGSAASAPVKASASLAQEEAELAEETTADYYTVDELKAKYGSEYQIVYVRPAALGTVTGDPTAQPENAGATYDNPYLGMGNGWTQYGGAYGAFLKHTGGSKKTVFALTDDWTHGDSSLSLVLGAVNSTDKVVITSAKKSGVSYINNSLADLTFSGGSSRYFSLTFDEITLKYNITTTNQTPRIITFSCDLKFTENTKIEYDTYDGSGLAIYYGETSGNTLTPRDGDTVIEILGGKVLMIDKTIVGTYHNGNLRYVIGANTSKISIGGTSNMSGDLHHLRVLNGDVTIDKNKGTVADIYEGGVADINGNITLNMNGGSLYRLAMFTTDTSSVMCGNWVVNYHGGDIANPPYNADAKWPYDTGARNITAKNRVLVANTDNSYCSAKIDSFKNQPVVTGSEDKLFTTVITYNGNKGRASVRFDAGATYTLPEGVTSTYIGTDSLAFHNRTSPKLVLTRNSSSVEKVLVNTTPYTFTSDTVEVDLGTTNQVLNSKEISVTFVDTYTVSVNGESAKYEHGAEITLPEAPAAEAGKEFAGWSDGNATYDAGATYTVTGAAEITATWTTLTYTVTVTANPTEGGTVTGAGEYNYNNDVTLTATANTGYKFVGWFKDNTTEAESTDVTISFKATENVAYVAKFEAIKNVAKIGDDEYETLAEAVAIGGNITLLDNVTESVTIGKDVVLDLAGKTITGGIAVAEGITATVKNGTISGGATVEGAILYASSNKTDFSVAVHNKGALTLENVNISGVGVGIYAENATTEIKNTEANTITASYRAVTTAKGDESDVTISGGNFITTAYDSADANSWSYAPVYWYSKGKLTIGGGKFDNTTSGTSAAAVIVSMGTVEITAGEFGAKDGLKIGDYVELSANSTVTVSGGKFESTRSGVYIDADSGKFTDEGETTVISITGGEFYGDDTYGGLRIKDTNLANITATVTGGKFEKGTEDKLSLILADSHKATEENGIYTVSEKEKYTVVVNGTSGEYVIGAEITLPEAPTAEAGKEFAGWSDGTTTYEAGATYTVKGAAEITATWNTLKYTVVVNGTSGEYVYGAEITLPEAPAAEAGKEFAGWSDGTTTYEAGATYTVKGAAEITATYTKTEISVPEETALTVTVSLPDKKGHTYENIGKVFYREKGTETYSETTFDDIVDEETRNDENSVVDTSFTVKIDTVEKDKTYEIAISKNGYITYTEEITIAEGANTISATLIGGDIKGKETDFCGDGKVDYDDFVRVIRGFIYSDTDEYKAFMPLVDLNEDGTINVKDLDIIKSGFGKSYEKAE